MRAQRVNLAVEPYTELPWAWVKTLPEAVHACVRACACVCARACLSVCPVSVGAAVVSSTVGKVVVLLMQEPELLFFNLLL